MTQTISAEHLKQFIEHIERLNEDKRIILADIKDVFAEAKAEGFDVPAIKEIIKLRAKDKADIEEEEFILDTYKLALGMIPEKE